MEYPPDGFQHALAEILAQSTSAISGAAITAMADHVDVLLQHAERSVVAEKLCRQFTESAEHTPDLFFVVGLLHKHANRLQDAAESLNSARLKYGGTRPNLAKEMRCCLELARIYQSLEDFQTAHLYLSERAEPILRRADMLHPRLKAEYLLAMASICPDIGRLKEAKTYGEESLRLYREIGDPSGEFQALIHLCFALRQMGEYPEARARFKHARSIHGSAGLGQRASVHLLNIEVHLKWYCGDLEAALMPAQQLVQLADEEELGNQLLYAQLLLGNLHRDLGSFAEADHWYAETRRLTAELGHDLFMPWVDVQTGWLRLLEKRRDAAYELFHRSLDTSDRGQAMSYQVFLAALHLLEGRTQIAREMLLESYGYYIRSGDMLSLCALDCLLGYLHVLDDQRVLAVGRLTRAFGWMAAQRIDYFPNWWHPQIMAEVARFALDAGVQPHTAERILVRLGAPILAQRGGAPDAGGQDLLPNLDRVRSLHVRRALEEMLADGRLRAENFAQLEQELITAEHRRRPNYTLIAVCGLYLAGLQREEIAAQLQLAPTSVKNYITTLYSHFRLQQCRFSGQRARRQRLRVMAAERGWV